MPTKTKTGLSPADAKRLAKRPYYAFLYARNILHSRLPEKLEMILANDPQSCYLYAKHVIKGQLPDALHSAILMGSFGESNEWIKQYVEEFCTKKPKKTRAKKV